MVALVLALAACGKDEEPAPEGCAIGARPLTTAIAGDANSDGVVDVADGAFVLDRLFRGGASPPCTDAADVVADTRVDVGDATAIWYHLFAGTTALPTLSAPCAAPATKDDAACADGLALGFSGTGPVTVELSSPLDVEALSVSIVADGCSVADVSLAGGPLAEKHDGGLRDGGFARVEPTSGGAVAAVAMDLDGDAVLPAGDASLLTLTLASNACGPCTLSFADGQVGGGEPVANVVSAHGRSYAPALGTATVEVCP